MMIDPTKCQQVSEHKHDAPLTCCAFDASGRFVIAGGRDRKLVCLDVAAARMSTLDGHETWVSAIVRAGAELVLTADYAGRVIAWDCAGESPTPRWNIDAHPSTVHALAVSADGTLFATGDRDGTIRIGQTSDGQTSDGQTSDGQRAQEVMKVEYPVYGLAFHPDGRQLVSADRRPKNPRLVLWDFATGKELRVIDVPQLSAYRRVEDIEWGGIRAIMLSPDGDTLVACGSNQYAGPACALLFDVATGDLKRTLSSSLKGFYYSAQFHPQGFLLTTGGDVGKGEFRAWDPGKDESLATVATAGPCTAISIHPDGQSCAIAQLNGKGSYPDSGSLTLFAWTD